MRKVSIILILLAALGGGAWHLGWFGAAQRETASARERGSERQAAPVNVIASPVEQVDLPIRQTSFGWVEPVQTVAVRARVASQLVAQHFSEGQMVKKGDLLFSLDDRELAAQVAKDEATLEKDLALQARAEADLSRTRQLVARNVGTQQALDLAIAESKSAAATVVADRAALDANRTRLSYAKIRAPITGRTGSIGVSPGNLVSGSESGTPLVTLTSMDPIRVSFTLPERSLPQLRAAMDRPDDLPVHVVEEGRRLATGKLSFIDSAVDAATGTITVKALFDNPQMTLWPGRYVDVELDTAVHRNAVVAPANAIQQGQSGPYVFVATEGGTAELRNVKLGATSGDRVEIVSGLSRGERVIVEGQLRLTNGARVAVREGRPAQHVSEARTGAEPPTAARN